MMVAAHLSDLQAAKTVGLKTAFVARPDEFGSGTLRRPDSEARRVGRCLGPELRAAGYDASVH